MVPVTGTAFAGHLLFLQATMDQLICASLFTHPLLWNEMSKDCAALHPSHQKLFKTFSDISEGCTRTSYAPGTIQLLIHFTRNGTDQSMSKRFINFPYSISRAISIDSDCCRLPRYFQHAHFIPIVGVGKRGEYNWSMVTCQSSTRLELP